MIDVLDVRLDVLCQAFALFRRSESGSIMPAHGRSTALEIIV